MLALFLVISIAHGSLIDGLGFGVVILISMGYTAASPAFGDLHRRTMEVEWCEDMCCIRDVWFRHRR